VWRGGGGAPGFSSQLLHQGAHSHPKLHLQVISGLPLASQGACISTVHRNSCRHTHIHVHLQHKSKINKEKYSRQSSSKMEKREVWSRGSNDIPAGTRCSCSLEPHDTLSLCMSSPGWTWAHSSSTEPIYLLTRAPHSLDMCSHQFHTAWTQAHTSSTQPGHMLTPAPHSLDMCSHQLHTALTSAHTSSTQPGHVLTPAPHSLDMCSHQFHTARTCAHTSSTQPIHLLTPAPHSLDMCSTSSTQPGHVLTPAPHSLNKYSHQLHTAWTCAHTSSTQPGHVLTPNPHSLDTCSHQLHTPPPPPHTHTLVASLTHNLFFPLSGLFTMIC
jgi:hypothetical protein